MKKPRILVVDDEPDLVQVLKHHLTREHYDVATAGDGEAALTEARRNIPDLIVLDLMLPGIDGHEVCRRLRQDPRTEHVPIVMLTAKSEETDVVIGLAQGADDYVCKPMRSMREFVARIAARLRSSEQRKTGDERRVLQFGNLVIDSVKHEVSIDGEAVKLTMTEFKLLRFLIQNAGRAFSRNELLDAAVGADTIVIDRNVDVHVATLRKKLADYGRHILTIRGLGYKFREHPDATD